MPTEDGQASKVTKLFVWGSNDKWQLGMNNTEDNKEDTHSTREVIVPHQLDPDPF